MLRLTPTLPEEQEGEGNAYAGRTLLAACWQGKTELPVMLIIIIRLVNQHVAPSLACLGLCIWKIGRFREYA